MSYQAVPNRQTKFGRRKEPHTITITKGENIRKFTVRSVMFAGICSVVGLFMVGYLGATAYLVLRDDLTRIIHQAFLILSRQVELTGLTAVT